MITHHIEDWKVESNCQDNTMIGFGEDSWSPGALRSPYAGCQYSIASNCSSGWELSMEKQVLLVNSITVTDLATYIQTVKPSVFFASLCKVFE